MVLAGCWSPQEPAGGAIIDWVDLIRLNGVTYHRSNQPDDSIAKLVLGMAVGQVDFRLQGNVDDPSYKVKDGDASFLNKGTLIRSIEGYAPSFRVAVQVNDTTQLYEAYTNVNAKQGSDLWDLKEKVTAIEIISQEDGTSLLGTVTDGAQIASIVDAIAAAPVAQDLAFAGEGTSYQLSFVLKDTTTFKQVYFTDNHWLTPGLNLPSTVTTTIKQAVQP